MKRIYLLTLPIALAVSSLIYSEKTLACDTPETVKAASQPFIATTAKPADVLYKQIMLQMHSKMEKVNPKGISQDRQFFELMIPHHEAAVQMAQVILLHTQDEKVKNLALSIIADQQNEIVFMKLSLKGESK